MLRSGQLRIAREQEIGLLLGALQHVHVRAEIGHVHLRQAVLAGAEEVARAAQPQILLGDLEAVVGLRHDGKARAVFLPVVVGDEDAPALVLPAPDAAAELMELAETEALRVLHDHQRRVRHVHAHLDDRGGHEDVDLARDHG